MISDLLLFRSYNFGGIRNADVKIDRAQSLLAIQFHLPFVKLLILENIGNPSSIIIYNEHDNICDKNIINQCHLEVKIYY